VSELEAASEPELPKRKKPKRRRVPFIGPLFSWDLVRLARRGQDARSRTILSLVLLLTLLVFTVIWFHTTNLYDLFFGTQQVLGGNEPQRFAEQFSLALLIAQMGVMVLLTPAYAAGSIAEEKERRTWQYLLSTDLSNREIVLGKFFGRVVFLLGIMMAGLPVLALTGLVGGISEMFLIFGYLLTGSTVALLAAAGITSAIYASTFRGAMFRSYGLAALYIFFGGGVYPLLSPFAVLVGLDLAKDDLNHFLLLGCGYIFAQMVLTAIILRMGVVRIRRVERRAPRRSRYREEYGRDRRPVARPVGTADRKRDDDRWGESDERTRRRHRSPEWADKPRIGNRDPFAWKEKYTLGTKRTADDESIRSLMVVIGVLVAVFLGLIVFIAAIAGAADRRSGAETFSKMLILAGMAGVFTHLMTLGPAACGAVIREKARLTLESLLTIPVPRRDILAPKWQITFSRGWWWGGPGIICVVLGMLASPIGPAGFPTAVYLPAAASLCVSFGLWLSCRVTTIVRAVMIYMSVAGALALVPLVVWWVFDDRDKLPAVVVMSAFAVLASLAAWIFWRMSVREFEKYGRE
jgi:ABC-type transport system involved in multi-copper enzyme maturation permease subunit